MCVAGQDEGAPPLSAGRVRRNSSSVSVRCGVSQRESRTRVVKASRERSVVCPIPRRRGEASPFVLRSASFSHAAAPGSAPLRCDSLAQAARSPAKRPSFLSRVLLLISSLPMDEIVPREKDNDTVSRACRIKLNSNATNYKLKIY